jgi:hypothetical protein
MFNPILDIALMHAAANKKRTRILDANGEAVILDQEEEQPLENKLNERLKCDFDNTQKTIITKLQKQLVDNIDSLDPHEIHSLSTSMMACLEVLRNSDEIFEID